MSIGQSVNCRRISAISIIIAGILALSVCLVYGNSSTVPARQMDCRCNGTIVRLVDCKHIGIIGVWFILIDFVLKAHTAQYQSVSFLTACGLVSVEKDLHRLSARRYQR